MDSKYYSVYFFLILLLRFKEKRKTSYVIPSLMLFYSWAMWKCYLAKNMFKVVYESSIHKHVLLLHSQTEIVIDGLQ